jgi:hypothetical protein
MRRGGGGARGAAFRRLNRVSKDEENDIRNVIHAAKREPEKGT